MTNVSIENRWTYILFRQPEKMSILITKWMLPWESIST
jgi:hypothetical protein